MRFLPIVALTFSLFTCQQAPEPVAVERASIDDQVYELTDIPGSDIQRAALKDELGNTVEAGFLLNGLKQGTWTTYGTESAAPTKIVSYADGALYGPYVEMDQQGRYALLANYQNNQLHGPWVQYRIGRPEKTANYVRSGITTKRG